MSSAITLVGQQQVIAITTRLIIGIRLQGTIAYVDPRNRHVIKPRPYLAYLAETLRRLHCDVCLFVPTHEEHDRDAIRLFHARDFPTPFRYLHDQSKLVGAGGGRGNRKRGLAPNNYTEYLRIRANEVNGTGQATDRILFIDSEINYRFTPVQTLILDNYEPLTRRQQRELVKEQRSNPFGGSNSQQARRYAAAAAKATNSTVRHRAQVHAQQLQAQIDEAEAHTAFLKAEQARVPLVDETADFEPLAASRRAAPSSSPRPLPFQAAASPRSSVSSDSRGRVAGRERRSGAAAAAAAASAEAGEGGSGASPAATGMSHALAINLEDYSLVALAEMIAEMAASDVSVGDYLKREPLIEKVDVPFHGKANYLPPENCDNIEPLNWEEIKVMEKAATDSGVPETMEETAEHKDFFQ